jgi:hypothetical protein
VFVERITEAEDVYAFDFLFPGTPVRRLDFRQCLPLTDKRTTRTTYLVLSERDQDAAGNLIQALPSAKVTALKPEEAALMGPATLVEVAPGTPALTVSNAAHARFEPGLRLVGYDWSGPTLKAGQSLFLTLYWKAEAMVEADLTAFLHIGTGEGNTPVVAQRDGQPCQGLYPTSQWQVGDVVPDGFAVVVPPDTPPGDYPLVVGWYQYPSLDRLRLAEADTPLKDNRAVIGTITITSP